MLRFAAVGKTYRGGSSPAVGNVTFDVQPGEIVGLVGLNGAGKTTLLRMAAGLLLPSQGTVYVEGHDVARDKRAASRQIGWVPELPIFPPRTPLFDTLGYLAGYYAGEAGSANDRRTLLRAVGLEPQERAPYSTLSQGMKKRFAVATSMLGQPSNYLLDELLNGLDPEWIRWARDWMVGLRQRGAAILLSSHLLGELEGIADRYAFIHQGQLIGVVPRGAIGQHLPPRFLVRLANPNDAVLAVLAGFGEVFLDQQVIRIEGPGVPPETVTTELNRRGYIIQEFRVEEPNLEEFFFHLIAQVRAQ